MSSIKKRKHQILDSDDDDVPIVKKNGSSKTKTSTTQVNEKKTNGKKKKRVVLLSDSDEDGNDDAENSINNIKKNAKIRAKQLTNGKEEKPAKKSITSSTSNNKKTPPSDSKQKNILSYFKPVNTNNKKDEDQNQTPKTNQVVDDEGFMFTQVKKPSEKNSSVVDKKKTNLKNDDQISKVKKVSIDNEKSENNIHKKESNDKKIKDPIIKEKKEQLSKKPKSSPQKPIQRPKDTDEIKEKLVMSKESPKKRSTKPVIKKEHPEKSESIKPALPRIVEKKRISQLWVDKHKPQNIKQVIGQQGDRSALNKLMKWLRFWHQNLDKKPAYSKWGSEDGAGFRAALLSGPPGIGKTTTAQLVCKELGYDSLILNASDTRSKKSMQENVRELLQNTKLTDFFKSSTTSSKKQKLTTKHCLIMDEVDGVSGNEDRGGVAELIQLIKSTKIPIICICNERGDTKVRSLVNYCFDLRFPAPKLEQIKATLLSIAYKENVKVSPDVLNDLIVSSNYDIRQCIHNLYLFASNHKNLGTMINKNEKPIKDVRLTPFEAIRKVFCSEQEYTLMTFKDKSDLFFCDYSIMPLFVYENYPQVNLSSKYSNVGKQFIRLYKTIESISYGDLFEKEIRSNQTWSLLPIQAAFSTVMPSYYMKSHKGLSYAQFPQFMGKLSTTNKNNRIAEELVSHMKLSISGSKTSFVLDYLEPLRNRIINSLLNLDKAGISTVLDMLEKYSLTKQDMDSILELCLWFGDEDPMKRIDAKTKAALTRAYNKKDFLLPYARDGDSRKVSGGKKATKKKTGKKGKKGKKQEWETSSEDEDESDQDTEDEDFDDFY